MGAGSTRAHPRAGLHHHARRLRGSRDRDDPEGHRRRPPRHRSARLGVQRVLSRQPVRCRRRRSRRRSQRAGAAVRRRARAVRDRSDRGRARAQHARAGRSPGGAGRRRGCDPGGRVRRDRPGVSAGVAAADVRGVVDRVGAARPDRTGGERRGGRGLRLAVGVPRPVAARRARGDDDRAPAARARRARRRGADRSPCRTR